ncbi:MAG TPA: alpha/beta fold hydrolase [Planctomycetaceae bacterium]|nr:alpha/beta fold hydrolase [Planctomycetaceae bacterium]
MLKRIAYAGMNGNVWDAGEGPVTLLVHGFPLDHTMWKYQLEALPSGRRVVAPDLRGFGGSDGETSDPMTMERFADDLAALLDALAIEEPITLCGLSMGGYIALAFWRNHRDRLKQLILCDTRAAADDEATKRTRELTARRALTEGSGFLVDAMLPKLFAPETLQRRRADVESIAEVIRTTRPETIAGALRGMAERRDSTSDLPTIELPVRVIVGEHDVITPPEEMRRMAEAMPHATFHSIPRAGHMAPWEAPESFNPLLWDSPS